MAQDLLLNTSHLDQRAKQTDCQQEALVYWQQSRRGIKIVDKNLKVTEAGKGDDFVWVSINGVTIYSCYISPNNSPVDYSIFLDSLGGEIMTKWMFTLNLVADHLQTHQILGSAE